METQRYIMHIDLNAFFMTCEEINNPSLVGKIAAVGGVGRRGIILSANYAARKKGIRATMPTYMALELYKHLLVVPPSRGLYKRYSNLFFDYLRKKLNVQDIEITSIDEGYLDLTRILHKVDDKINYLINLQQDILKNTGLKCSIGLGTTRFLAKMASDYKKPMGVTTILTKTDIQQKIFPLPISSMLGIGRKTAPKLIELGIESIGDLYHNENPEIKLFLGKHYEDIMHRLDGTSNDLVSNDPSDPKSIGNSSTFLHNTNDFEEIRALIHELAEEVAQRIKTEKQMARTLQIVIKDANFKSMNRSMTLPTPFDDFETIYTQSLLLFEKNYRNQFIRLVGITLQNLSLKEETLEQLSLFDISEEKDDDQTQILLRKFNEKVKDTPLIRASELKKVKS